MAVTANRRELSVLQEVLIALRPIGGNESFASPCRYDRIAEPIFVDFSVLAENNLEVGGELSADVMKHLEHASNRITVIILFVLGAIAFIEDLGWLINH